MCIFGRDSRMAASDILLQGPGLRGKGILWWRVPPHGQNLQAICGLTDIGPLFVFLHRIFCSANISAKMQISIRETKPTIAGDHKLVRARRCPRTCIVSYI